MVAGLALVLLFMSAGVAMALAPAAGAPVVGPLVSTSTSESAGSLVADATVLSANFNEPPVLANSYSLTLSDGTNAGTLSSAAGNLSAAVNGNSVVFTVHGGPTMVVGSGLSLSVLEILAAGDRDRAQLRRHGRRADVG